MGESSPEQGGTRKLKLTSSVRHHMLNQRKPLKSQQEQIQICNVLALLFGNLNVILCAWSIAEVRYCNSIIRGTRHEERVDLSLLWGGVCGGQLDNKRCKWLWSSLSYFVCGYCVFRQTPANHDDDRARNNGSFVQIQILGSWAETKSLVFQE